MVAWEGATAGMHRAGDEAVSAWIELAAAVERGRHCSQGTAALRSVLLKGLAEAAAQNLHVELLDFLGLTGLDGVATGTSAIVGRSTSARGSCDAEHEAEAEGHQDWPAMRFALLQSVLQQLEQGGALCEAELRISPGLVPDPALR